MEIISEHPIAAALIIGVILFYVLMLLVGYRRYNHRKSMWSDYYDDPDYIDVGVHEDQPLVLTPAQIWPENDRLPMRNRFLAPDDQSEAMADQIVQDQGVAHEEAGAVVEDPAVEPDATTFYHLREVIGQFTYVLGKDGYVGVIEAMRSGDDAPIVEVPEEWREPITVAVFEVVRLRAISGRGIPSSELIALLDDPAVAAAVNEQGGGRHA